ncbi:hypothetical protein DL764_009787 [Monosporascus ibericus]|uniref:Uncharacterized protein n=1 Tax=Monosporascus ibericus TaxID=155417 RepID=A0A4Q4SW57_9PEZI|nr:hypothetical protein DL764_009787 [Monosporascus ibericus]
MKGSRPVCLLCRHRLATSVPSSGPPRPAAQQRHARARLTTSTGHRHDTTRGAATAASEGSPNTASPAETVTAAHDTIRVRRYLNAESRKSKPESRNGWPRRPPEKSSAKVDDLFRQIVAEQQQLNPAQQAESKADAKTATLATLVQDIGKLDDMVRDDAVEAAYVFLKTEIYPVVRKPDTLVPQVFYKVVAELMQKVVAAKKAAMDSTKLPTVAEICSVDADIGPLKPRKWADLVGELVKTLVGMSTSTEDYPSTEAYKAHLATRAALLADLVESWKVLSSPKFTLVGASHASEMLDGFWFPTLDKLSLLKFSKGNNFTAAFSSVFPQYSSHELGAPVAALTIATYALFQDPLRSNDKVRRSAARFMFNIDYLISHVQIQDNALRDLFAKTFPSLEGYVMGEWPRIKAQLRHRPEVAGGPLPHRRVPGLTSPKAMNTWALNQAYLARNSIEIDRMWEEFVGSDKDLTEERALHLQNNVDFINSFINTYMALNQPAKALTALNMLKKIGLSPTLKTWNTMLDGCKKARNVNAIRNIWAKLVRTGGQLDAAVWTTRVSGLIESGDLEGGLKALEEMTALWKRGLNDPKSCAVKPTIEPVNAALAGLIRQRRVPAAERLLDWAVRQGIEPDIITFNTLLRPMIREERHRDIQRLFATMKKREVQADAATFTIVLDATLARIELPSRSASESELASFKEAQKEAVARVLSQMEAVGLETNLQTYGKMIYLLLQSGGDRATEAVKAVLAHLWEQGHELSPHIYTMLVEHYFWQRPPDLASVGELLQHAQKSRHFANGAPEMDRIFYDRVVKGYALADRPATALDLYYRLSEEGYLVTLGTQVELLRVLVQHELWDEAKGLVDNTKRLFEEQNGAAGLDPDDSFWQHGFWAVAERNGLVEWGRGPAADGGGGGGGGAAGTGGARH